MFSDQDILFMRRALQIAQLGGVHAAPNPMVGAVIVYQGKIIGEGYHEKYGEPHAEVNAVNSVEDKSVLNEATIFVTLEPCAHHGKTPPCSDLIVKHNFARVVVGCQDSFAKVAGKGIQKMKAAGIQVDIGLLEKEARELNKRFFTYHEQKRPCVILKWAQTEDGFMDRLPDDREKGVNWITTPAMKSLVHQWRSEEQAIIVGWKTVQNDDPSLTVREIEGESPHRYIIDPHCQVPLDRKVMNDGNKTTFLVRENTFDTLPSFVEVIELKDYSTSSILSLLYERNILSVFIEGGAYTIQQFIDDGNWDEARILTGPVTFERGLAAPQILKGEEFDRKSFDSNVITYYKNP